MKLKHHVFTLTLLATTSLMSSVLAACSTGSKTSNSPQQTPISEVSPAQEVVQKTAQHSGEMNHGMSMDLGAVDADYDLRFIDAMILHHQGAIDMAKAALQNSKRPEIQQLANNIIQAQEQEITLMRQWRTTWYPKAGSQPMAHHADMNHTMEMSPEQMQSMMMTMDLGAADAEFDLRFINAMIPHHEGALVMAKDALSKSTRNEIKQVTEQILTSQQKEIDEMMQWRKAWYNQ